MKLEIQILWSAQGNYKEAARRDTDIAYLVLHDAEALCAVDYAAQLATKVTSRSVHFVVDEESVWQVVRARDIAWHCGTRGAYFHPYCRNENSLGIALCGSLQQGRPAITEAVQVRTAALVRTLLLRYRLAPARELRHYDVTHRCCPAAFVEQSSVWRAFLGGLD